MLANQTGTEGETEQEKLWARRLKNILEEFDKL